MRCVTLVAETPSAVSAAVHCAAANETRIPGPGVKLTISTDHPFGSAASILSRYARHGVAVDTGPFCTPQSPRARPGGIHCTV
jgi:hypothetical protein